MRWVLRLALMIAALGCGVRTRNHTIDRITGEHEVRAAQQQRFDAMVKQDVAVLDFLLDEDLSYVHTDGGMQSKNEFIEMIRSRRLIYESIEPSEVHVRVYSGAAIATGVSQMRVRSAAGVSSFRIRFTETYAHKAGRWLLAAWQATRAPT
ncbi:MAG TPA: nuclear transport factor 2 family protein [Gemmatimonadaceae bacterium]|nr:nuclear transport factor 2 family protein [Gemmatimonadaceae bacterium]